MALTDKLTNIANAVRMKNNSTESMTLNQIQEKILELRMYNNELETLFNKETKTLVLNTRSIPAYICCGHESLATFENRMATYIGRNAFDGCEKLKNVYIPMIRSIGIEAFIYCKSLEKLDFTFALDIEERAFLGCGLKTLILNNYDSLKISTLRNTNAFTNTPISNGTGFIYVRDNFLESYKTATNWAAYASQIKPISELEEEV